MTDIVTAVSKLTYKPGWYFRIEYGSFWNALIIGARVLHSTTLEPVTFDIRRVIPSVATVSDEAFLSWVKDMLIEAEIHELREFLRFDGKLLDDPHATAAA